MERRLLIAFALSTILILGYQIFYYAPRMKKAQEAKRVEMEMQAYADSVAAAEQALREPAPTEDTSTTATDEALTQTPDADPEAPATASDGQFTPEFITVDTPLMRVMLSTAGGDIVSAQLGEYLTEGQPVELFAWHPDLEAGVNTLTLVGDTRRLPLSEFEFKPVSGVSRYRVDENNTSTTVTLAATTPSGQRITREYVFHYDSYVVDNNVTLSGSEFGFARGVEWSFGPGMRSTELNQKEDYDQMKALVRLGDELHKKKRGDNESYNGTLQWVALKMKYFTAIMMPSETAVASVNVASVKDANFMSAATTLPVVQRTGQISQSVSLYMGPLDYESLKAMDGDLEKIVDIGFDHFKIFKPVSAVILWGLVNMYKFIPNYGWVIIIMSALTKVLFYRLTHKSFKSMKQMQDLQPKLAALKEKYKDDRQKLSEETMKTYKEAGVNPLGGCLPMLLQMPVFIALFSVLRSTIEVRQAPWLLWINDLSQQDVLFTMPFSLPMMGDAFSVLPLLMGAAMLMQSKIGGGIGGPSSGATMPAGMTYLMPIMFTVLFYKMPSGLVLYWIVNTVLSIWQQWYINKGGSDDEAPAAEPTKPNNPKRGRAKKRPVKASK